MFRRIGLAALVLILALVNWSILQKEQHLASGRVVYLELAPVDPRSLMQGDYMALRFRLERDVHAALRRKTETARRSHEVAASDGTVVVTLDPQNIGTFKRIHTDQDLSQHEIILRYRVRNGEVKFATNAFFFQEGHAEYYQPARYGQFRVDHNGELLLVAMYDNDLNKLEPDRKAL